MLSTLESRAMRDWWNVVPRCVEEGCLNFAPSSDELRTAQDSLCGRRGTDIQKRV